MTASTTHRRALAAALAAATACAVLPATAAAATTSSVNATEAVSAGSLSISAPATLAFPGVTLNGTSDQTVTKPQAIDVNDATGSGNGWNLTGTSTTFTAGSLTLPTSAVTLTGAPGVACTGSTTCTTATNSAITTYPYTLPAAVPAPGATKFYNAAINTGMADQTVTPTWSLTVPSTAKVGNYSSTWTLSLVSAP